MRNDEKTIEDLKAANSGPLKSQDGDGMSAKIGAEQYLECSAKTKRGIREVFEAASKSAIKHRKRKRKFKLSNLFKKSS